MGGIDDCGVEIGTKNSPCRTEIEKAQAELRQERDVREARQRELEFLENGGNPLDFKCGYVSVSLQSTLLNARHLDQYLSGGAQGSFAVAASPHGDSFESGGRPEASVPRQNNVDNLLNFAGKNDMSEGGKNTTRPGRKNNIYSSEQSSLLARNRNGKEMEDSAIFQPYARRNRSRPNRGGGRLNSADAVHSRSGVGCSVASCVGLRDGKGSSSERNSQKDQNAYITLKPKTESMNGDTVSRASTSENRLDGKIDVEQDLVSTSSLNHLPGDKFEATARGSNNRPKQSFGNRKSSADTARAGRNIVQGFGSLISGKADAFPSKSRERDDIKVELNASGDEEGDVKELTGEIKDAREAITRKDLQPGTYPQIGIDHIENNAACDDAANASSSGVTVEQLSDPEKNQNLVDSETVKEKSVLMIIEGNISDRKENDTAHLNQAGDGAAAEAEKETNAIRSLRLERDSASVVVEGEDKQQKEKNAGDTIEDGNEETSYRLAVDVSSTCEAPTTSLSGMEYVAPPDKISLCNNSNSVDKAYEDSVLEEALIIQAKHKRIAELSVHSLAVESRQRSLWDFVLEEMTWLANDFAQERLWKMTAAAQLCHCIASVSQLRYEEQNRQWKLKTVAHSLSKAVMQFWRSAEALLNIDETHSGLKDDQLECMGSQKKNNVEVSEGITGDHNMQDSCQKLLVQNPDESTRHCIQGYALRFLRYNKSQVYQVLVEMPKTPDIVSHMDIMEWNDDLTEERLFYAVPSGAMEIYRSFIESYVAERERTGGNIKEDVDTYVFTTVADQIYQETGYDEDEAGTGRFYLPGAFDGKQLSKFIMKKRKNPSGLYDPAADLHYGQFGSHPSMKKGPVNLNVSPVSTKRIRTTYRQGGLFRPGLDAGPVTQANNEASSGDTTSFHDDLSILRGSSHAQRGMEVESADYEKDFPYEFTETSPKPKKKKKKKKKKKDSIAEWGWHLGFAAQREHSKKRLEHFGSNETSGFFGQHHAKKPKMMKHCLDNSYDNTMAMNGSISASMASQMSYMSNPKKLMKLIGGHDRSRKVKAPKTSSLHSGPGNSWSLYEDQALVVLVHDMGPNWELVSDAINSTLQFKYIFRKPKECKDRHKILMDKTASDGADSAEDSRTSQSYPSTLPGIPKGSARQLFQRLQSPVEEDALMEHFEKIVQIVQRRHRRRIQSKNENHEGKLIAVHNSHIVALSQGPNNLGGVLLTPLDLIEATLSNPDALPINNYQASHDNMGMTIQGAASSVATTVPNSSLPGSPSGFPSTTTGSPSGPLSASFRDGRYNVPKVSPSSGDEQQRLHHKPMLSNRTVLQSKSGTLSGSDCGVHGLPGGNGLGMASGMSRTLPVSRPAFQGIGSSQVLNSDTVMGMPDPVNTYSGSGACQANSMLRPSEPSEVVKGGRNAEHSREISVPERQMHANRGNAQGVSPFNGSGSAFSSQTFPGIPQQHQISPKKPNPQLPQTNHPPGPHSKQQMYLKLAKDRNMQPRYLQQQQYAASSNLKPHVQTQPKFPISSPLQNNAPTKPLAPPQSMPLSIVTPSSPMASTQNQPKNQLLPHGPSRNMIPGVVGLKQRQPQQRQFQQPRKNHPQPRQQAQVHQGNNLLKGVSRGSMLIQQKLPIDPSHLNGLSGAGKNSFQSSKPKSSQNTPVQQPKQQLPSGPSATSLKQHPQSQVPSLTKGSTQGTALMASNQQQGQKNQVVQTQRIPQNCQLPIKFMSEKVQGDEKFMPPTTPVDSSSKVTAVASAIRIQNKVPEAVHDPGLPSTSGQGVSTECPTLPSSISGVLPSVGQGLGQKHVSDTSSQSGNVGGGLESRGQQQIFPQSKQSPSPLPPSQQLEEQSLQQKTVAQGDTHVGSTNS